MSGTANTSGTEQQTSTVKPSAGHVDDVTMLGISKQDILRLGGIWPPVGTTQQTVTAMSSVSALPAICTTKGVSGLSVDDLTKLSKDELRRLCEIQNRLERMEWQSCVSSPITTRHKSCLLYTSTLPTKRIV